ncbi:unnamed protein product [Cuscuta europaea]|uniref:Uncharacterized protein n=1 Tax=Cuscuta europaea TaxID=41803 RepID=A0A9P0Z0P7_CUSEU|nr:unnamed protein product [Cuscuta europaea]
MDFYGYQGVAVGVGESHYPSLSSFYGYNASTPYDHSPFSYPSPNLVENSPNYYSSDYYHDYAGYSYATQPEVNYSVHNSSNSMLIQLDGPEQEDDTDFDEYDPDPYSGGYDISQTYGKPLPPSDRTCYPRSAASSLDNEIGKVVSADRGRVAVDFGRSDDLNKGISGNTSDYPVANGHYYRSGLESVDVCEGMFGYWPCWEKYQRNNGKENNYGGGGGGGSDQGVSSPWSYCAAADYLFGSPFGYGGGDQPTGEGFGSFSYGGYYRQ